MLTRSISLSALTLAALGVSLVVPRPLTADCYVGMKPECCEAHMKGWPLPASCGKANPTAPGSAGTTKPATSSGTSTAGKAAAEAISDIWNQIQADREKERQQQAERDRRARTASERQSEWDRRDRERERYYEERRRQLAEEMEVLQRQVAAEEEATRATEQERRRELTESALPDFDQIRNRRSDAGDQGRPSPGAKAAARSFHCEKRMYAEGTWFGWGTYLGNPTLEASRFSAAPADMRIGEGETRRESAELDGSSHRYWTRLSGRDLELRYERVSAGRVDSGYELRCSEQGAK